MTLSAKLDSIPKDQTVSELNTMLDTASVSISWYGERLVSIEGFEGTVEINQLVAKYLKASPDIEDGINLKERLDYYNLWTKVKRVCKDDKSLNDTWVYRYLVSAKETLYNKAKPIDYITTRLKGSLYPSKNHMCFSFSAEDFKQLWPNENPELICNERDWVAKKEMVEAAYQRSTRNGI
jgi:hypothetical protein